MKKLVLIFVLEFISVFSFSQKIYFDGEKLTCKVEEKNIIGSGVITLDTKKWMEMPYIVRQCDDSTVIIVDVAYDNKWNYPVSAIFDSQKIKGLSNRKKNDIRYAIVRGIEDLYMVLTGNKKYLDD